MNDKDIVKTLINRFDAEREIKANGVYYFTQIDLSYNSNHIEGSRLTHRQTKSLFDKDLFYPEDDKTEIKKDDIIETSNHFRAFDYVLDNIDLPLTQEFIKHLHLILKTASSDISKGYKIGEYKQYANMVGENETTAPKDVKREIEKLLENYNLLKEVALDNILDFYFVFEKIHPFQDGNGRVGRLIIFKECLKNGIIPIIIYDEVKNYYYRGLSEWGNGNKGYLRDTALLCQDTYREKLAYFDIK